MAHAGSLRPKVVSIDSGGHRERLRARRDELVSGHVDLVRSIARGIYARLPPSFELDDLIAEGLRELIEVATRYRPAEHGGAPFSAFARLRIRGAILDSVRDRHDRRAQNWTASTCVPLADVKMPSTALQPAAEAVFDQSREAERVMAAIERLPPRKAAILRLYYSPDEPTLAEVARALSLSEGHVTNLHSEAIREVRRLLA